MTDKHTGPRTDQPAPTSSDTRINTQAAKNPQVEDAGDESGASSGGGAISGTDNYPGLHDVTAEQAATSQTPPALDADGDGELAVRLLDTDGDGTADDAVVNAPENTSSVPPS